MNAELDALERQIGTAQRALDQRMWQRDRLRGEQTAAQAQLAELTDEAEIVAQTQALLTATHKRAKELSKTQLEEIVTSGLQSIFGPEYRFVIELTEKGGRSEAEFYIVSTMGGETVQARPQESRGGGIVDIVSTTLRIATLETCRPKQQGPLILDEPAKHVSDEYIQPTADFLTQISQVFERQIIMVTHSAALAGSGSKVFQVMLVGGKSETTELNGSAA